MTRSPTAWEEPASIVHRGDGLTVSFEITDAQYSVLRREVDGLLDKVRLLRAHDRELNRG